MPPTNAETCGSLAWRRGAIRALAMLGVAIVLVSPGCSCRTETPAERAAREAREAEEEKRRLEEERARQDLLLPSPRVLPGPVTRPSLAAKPGHWNAVAQPITANNDDFDGVLSQEVTDKQGRPIPALRTPFRVSSRRPVVLAEGASKDVEALFYLPPVGGPTRLRTTVRERRSGAMEYDTPTPLRPLLDHQYHFVVLADEPARYAFLDALYAVTATLPDTIDDEGVKDGASTLDAEKNYRVVALPIGDPSIEAPLPDNPLAWTSIAYVLWDEVDPERLRPAQRDALVDWINWGGQLIVSGPDSLDLLRGSFLEPLLPADSAGARAIAAEDLADAQRAWGVGKNSGDPLAAAKPWSGVALTAAADARSLPGLDGLLVERRVGRGRVVVSGFQLAQTELVKWRAGVENLFNAAILRRPPRRFARGGYDGDRLVTLWTDKPGIRLDPLRNTAVRYFARDAHEAPEQLSVSVVAETIQSGGAAGGFTSGPPRANSGAITDTGFKRLAPPAKRGGAAAWTDDNLVANAAREALRQSAGVSVPDASFVVGWLAVYLVLIVPANWFLFYALGRVELAWIAAPLIAVAGAVVVVRQAQLDIGFVRSQTEVALLELQPDTPRGLLTRFTALYTSLSTTYDLEFDNGTALAVPFPRVGPKDPYSRLERLSEVVYRRQEKARLLGLGVSSASTEFVRSEEMLDVSAAVPEGSTRVGRIAMGESRSGAPRIENLTEWPMTSVAVVRRPDGATGSAVLEGCWIGDLPAGKSATVSFLPVAAGPDAIPFALQRSEAAALAADDAARLDLEQLFAIALDPQRFEPGESRVVGRIDRALPGLAVKPAASQRVGATLVVGHLGYGPLPPPRSDANAPVDVQPQGSPQGSPRGARR